MEEGEVEKGEVEEGEVEEGEVERGAGVEEVEVEQYLYEVKWYVEEVKERYMYMSRLSVTETDYLCHTQTVTRDKNFL